MTYIQQGIWEDKESITTRKKSSGTSKSIKFARLNLTEHGTQAIHGLGKVDITFDNLYSICFPADKLPYEQKFDFGEESFTLTCHAIDKDYVFLSICNSKDFNEQLVTARDKTSQKPVSNNIELNYYSFICIEREKNCIAYIFNRNIKDIKQLLQTFFSQTMSCTVVPLLDPQVKDAVRRANRIGKLTFALDSIVCEQTNAYLKQFLEWNNQETSMYQIEVKVTPSRKLMETILDDNNLPKKVKRPKVEIFNTSGKQVVDLFKDNFSLQIKIPADIVKMEDISKLFDILQGHLDEVTASSEQS